MSEENLEVARQILVAFRKGDLADVWPEVADLIDPEIEMDTTRVPMPGLAAVNKGPEEVARFWTEWADAWGSLGQFDDPELIEAGDQVLAWFSQHEVQGKGSGVPIEMPEYGWVYTVRDGKILRATMYMKRADALRAAGLSE